MADWKRVLLETDISTGGVADNETGLVTGNDVFDYIDAQNFGTGDITAVIAGDGLTGGASSGSATLNVIGGDGITSTPNEVEVTVDDVTIELSATDGSGAVRAKTAAIADGGTALATADQIHAFVTGFGYTTNVGTVTSVSSATTAQLTVADGTSTPTLTIVTGAVANGGTALATGDQIYDFVTGFGYTTNIGDITSVTAGTGLTGGGTSGGVTLNVSGLTVSEFDAAAITTSAETFADNDTTLMTSAAILDLIQAESGDITEVLAGDNLTGGGSSGSVTIDLDQDLLAMISMSGVNAATTGDINLAGGDLTFTSGLSTGTAIGGDIFFKASNPGASSGMTQNAAVDVMKIAAATTNNGDPVVTIYGDLVVNGATSSVDVQTLTVEDKTILVADGAATAANATSSGLIVDTTATAANRANFLWKDSSAGVAGWEFKDDGAPGSYPSMGVAALTKGTADPTSVIMPTGALFYNTGGSGTKGLYLYID